MNKGSLKTLVSQTTTSTSEGTKHLQDSYNYYIIYHSLKIVSDMELAKELVDIGLCKHDDKLESSARKSKKLRLTFSVKNLHARLMMGYHYPSLKVK